MFEHFEKQIGRIVVTGGHGSPVLVRLKIEPVGGESPTDARLDIEAVRDLRYALDRALAAYDEEQARRAAERAEWTAKIASGAVKP